MAVDFCGVTVDANFIGPLKQGGRDKPKCWNVIFAGLSVCLGATGCRLDMAFNWESSL